LALKIKKDAKLKRIKIKYFSFTLVFEGIQGNMALSKFTAASRNAGEGAPGNSQFSTLRTHFINKKQ
jgi:hypothetical protein